MNTIGIDACKYGWCGIGHINKKMVWGCFTDLDDLLECHPNLERILIDIPIGLSSKKFRRTVDTKARKFLKKRKSSLFSPPSREALFANTYKEALAINRKIEGKGISIQAYNIGSKIKEVDEWADQKPKHIEIFEAHPELCFKTLNNEEDLLFSKHDKQGIEIRKQIVFQHQKKLKAVFDDIIKNYKRKEVKPDDILDAMALCIINLQNKSLKYVEDNNDRDERNRKVRIVYG
jgi:predicted RNase H-like nuclease